jgi:hypothetical protein
LVDEGGIDERGSQPANDAPDMLHLARQKRDVDRAWAAELRHLIGIINTRALST